MSWLYSLSSKSHDLVSNMFWFIKSTLVCKILKRTVHLCLSQMIILASATNDLIHNYHKMDIDLIVCLIKAI